VNVFLRSETLSAFDSQFLSFSAKNTFELNVRSASQVLPGLLDLLAVVEGDRAPVLPDATLDSFAKQAPQQDTCEHTRQLRHAYDTHHSDKATPHGYHNVYGPLLCHLQRARGDAALVVLEIGLGTNNTEIASNMGVMSNGGKWETRPGASLRALRDVLPRARVYGGDVDAAILFDEERIRTHWVDQLDAPSIARMHADFGESAYDMIIDDGLHGIGANLNSLAFGLQHVRPGGFVVVEDIGPSHNANVQRNWQLVGRLLRRDPLIETCLVRTGRTGKGVVKLLIVHKRAQPDDASLLARACTAPRAHARHVDRGMLRRE